MATALKRETVYAIGEVMRNHCGGDNAKIVVAPDALHCCTFCLQCAQLGVPLSNAGLNTGMVGSCDFFHDKYIHPIHQRVCKLWELHLRRINLVPPECHAFLMRELHLADRIGEVHSIASDLVDALGRVLAIIEDLPSPLLRKGMPGTQFMTEIRNVARPDQFDKICIFFDNLAVNLRKTLPEETAWDKLLNQLTAPRQAGGPKSCDLPCTNAGAYNCTNCCVPNCDNGKDGHVCRSAGTSNCPKEVYGHKQEDE